MDPKIKTVSESVEKRNVSDLDQAIDIAGTGLYNIKYCLVLALFLIASTVTEPVGYAYVLPAAKCDLKMTDAQRGFISSIPYIGIVITSYLWGYLVDTQGRKRVAVFSSVAAGFFGILSAFMPELISFVLLKFLTALCIAGPAGVPFAFIAEIIPKKNRELMLSIATAIMMSGTSIIAMLGLGVLSLDFRINFGLYDFRPWRLLAIINAAFFLLAAFFMSFGPESPKYLVAQGKHVEALKVLQTIYAKNKGKKLEDFPVKALTDSNFYKKRGILQSLKEQSVPLFKPPYVQWLLLNGFLLFGVFAALNGLQVWVPDILNRVLTENREGMTVCDIIALRINETVVAEVCDDTVAQSTFIINLVANTSCVAIALAGGSTVKIIGKKLLLILTFCIIGGFIVGVNFTTNNMLFATLLSSQLIIAMAIGPINVYLVEIFPTELRGMAVNLAMLMGRFGSVAGTNLVPVLISTACEITFYLFGGLLIFCGLLSLLLPKSQSSPSADKKSIQMETVERWKQIEISRL